MNFFARTFFLSTILISLGAAANGSISEIRKDFFNRTVDLHATPLMAAPTGDATYLISVYEATRNCAITPVLRWTNENGVSLSQAGSIGSSGRNCYATLVANIRVHAGTQPTIETSGDNDHSLYCLYASGLGFWPSGLERQAGLSNTTGLLPVNKVYAVSAYQASGSTNALLIAYSTGYAGKDVPYVTWSDENGNNTLTVPVGASTLLPLRVAGGSRVWIHTYPGDSTWYGLIIFENPSKGAGPFVNFEASLLNWNNATYPNWRNIFTAPSGGANVLLLGNITQPANPGATSEDLQFSWTGQDGMGCGAVLSASSSGMPASCISPAFVDGSEVVQFRTLNSPGSPWGASPAYSAEVEVLKF